MILERVAVIPLRNRAGAVVAHAIVDAADYDWASTFRWCLNANGYAWRNSVGAPGEAKHVYLHRALLNLRTGDVRQVDHINRDKLDNRRSNLRIGSNAMNRQNTPSMGGTSVFRGVCFDRARNRWKASAQLNGRTYNIGRYDRQEDAAAAASDWRARHMPFSHDADGHQGRPE